jgi:hypothetical protein
LRREIYLNTSSCAVTPKDQPRTRLQSIIGRTQFVSDSLSQKQWRNITSPVLSPGIHLRLLCLRDDQLLLIGRGRESLRAVQFQEMNSSSPWEITRVIGILENLIKAISGR